MKASVAGSIGLGVMATAVLVNWWLVPAVSGLSYPEWYLHEGPLVVLAVAAISAAWGELDHHTGLISRNPLEYAGACLQAAGLTLMSIGGHMRRDNQPDRLPLVDQLASFPVMLLVAGAVFAWLWLIAPLQYFATLVCGAPARASQTSSYYLYARMQQGKLLTCEKKARETSPQGYWNASMRDKPVTLTNAIAAGLLMLLQSMSTTF